MSDEAYEFSTDWFSRHEAIWQAVFQQLIPGAKKILEIGSYEGRSAVWLMANGFLPQRTGDLYCLDTWDRSAEHEKAEIEQAHARFDRNMEKARKRHTGITLHKIKDTSKRALTRFLADGHAASFDLIYVDGSHQAAEVLSDLVLSFELCRIGGVIVCDDYLWNFGQNPLLTPKPAIDAFVNCYGGRIFPVTNVPLFQFFMRKVAE